MREGRQYLSRRDGLVQGVRAREGRHLLLGAHQQQAPQLKLLQLCQGQDTAAAAASVCGLTSKRKLGSQERAGSWVWLDNQASPSRLMAADGKVLRAQAAPRACQTWGGERRSGLELGNECSLPSRSCCSGGAAKQLNSLERRGLPSERSGLLLTEGSSGVYSGSASKNACVSSVYRSLPQNVKENCCILSAEGTGSRGTCSSGRLSRWHTPDAEHSHLQHNKVAYSVRPLESYQASKAKPKAADVSAQLVHPPSLRPATLCNYNDSRSVQLAHSVPKGALVAWAFNAPQCVVASNNMLLSPSEQSLTPAAKLFNTKVGPPGKKDTHRIGAGVGEVTGQAADATALRRQSSLWPLAAAWKLRSSGQVQEALPWCCGVAAALGLPPLTCSVMRQGGINCESAYAIKAHRFHKVQPAGLHCSTQHAAWRSSQCWPCPIVQPSVSNAESVWATYATPKCSAAVIYSSVGIKMFSLLYGFWEYVFRKEEYRILLVGLDKAGKTNILENLKTHLSGHPGLEADKILPTVGLNVARLEAFRVQLMIWDLGGQTGLRSIWDKYYADSHALVFVIDAAAQQRWGLQAPFWLTVHIRLDGLVQVPGHIALDMLCHALCKPSAPLQPTCCSQVLTCRGTSDGAILYKTGHSLWTQ